MKPDISSNQDIDIHLHSILKAVQLAADLSVPKYTETKYNRQTNFLPPEGKIYTRQLSMAIKAFKRLKLTNPNKNLGPSSVNYGNFKPRLGMSGGKNSPP